jgi:hypothetical protein
MIVYNSFVCGHPRKFITAVINLRGVSTNKTIICFIAMQTYKELTNDSVSRVTDTKTVHVTLPPLLAKKPATTEATGPVSNDGLIQVPPWEGKVYLPLIGTRTMVDVVFIL